MMVDEDTLNLQLSIQGYGGPKLFKMAQAIMVDVLNFEMHVM